MFSPFKPNKRYFVRTVTFYHLVTYIGKAGNFYKFKDVQTLLNIDDWEDFYKSRPHLPPHYKPMQSGVLTINEAAIVDLSPWE